MNSNSFRICLALLATLCATGMSLGAQDLSATIGKLTGKVEIQTASGWVAARQGQVVGSGTTISTGFRSSAELNLGNAIVTVKALTRLTLAELAENAGVIITNLSLRVGKVSAEVSRVAGKTNDFKVKSPVSTASVRGTGFEFDGETIQVSHGTVDFEDKLGNVVPVPIGESARTNASGSGVVGNKSVVSEASNTVAAAGSDFGNADASAFVSPTSTDVPSISDYSDTISFDTLLATYQEFVNQTQAPTGRLTITIK